MALGQCAPGQLPPDNYPNIRDPRTISRPTIPPMPIAIHTITPRTICSCLIASWNITPRTITPQTIVPCANCLPDYSDFCHVLSALIWTLKSKHFKASLEFLLIKSFLVSMSNTNHCWSWK